MSSAGDAAVGCLLSIFKFVYEAIFNAWEQALGYTTSAFLLSVLSIITMLVLTGSCVLITVALNN